MALVLTSGPTVEPVTLAEVKAFCRIDDATEDVLLSSLILTSRLHIEAALGLALNTQSWTMTLDRWPRQGPVILPMRPVTAITALRLRDANGGATVWSSSEYELEGQAHPPRLVSRSGNWPAVQRATAAIEIDFIAGYGPNATDVPQPICHALLLLVAHWYENRDPFQTPSLSTVIPQAVSELLRPYRDPRL